MVGNKHEKGLIRLREAFKGNNRLTVNYEFTDLWTEAREWSLKPVYRLRATSKHIW